MLRRIFFTLMSSASLTGLWWLYALIVTPRLVPAILTETRLVPVETEEIQAEPPPGNIEDATRFLPDAPWATRAKFQIRLAKSVLFSQSWRPIDESEEIFEFKPFAMILFDAPNAPGSDGTTTSESKPPMTLIADAGLIHFAGKFDPVNQKVGRVIEGRLQGKVSATGSDGLTFKGRDLFFNEKAMELLSYLPIEFTYQQHRGNADQGMRVKLVPSPGAPRSDQMLSIGGFRHVQLNGRVEMDLSSDDGPLHVTSDEGFDFNPESHMASFKINVNAARPTGPEESDTLKCQYLDLVLEENAGGGSATAMHGRGDAPGLPIVRNNGPSAVNVTEPSDADLVTHPAGELDAKQEKPSRTASGSSRWAVRQLRATGSRAEFESQHNGLTAFMTNLIYDVPSRTIVLKDAKSVIVRQKDGTELRCPELTLIQDEQGQVESAQGRGAGWLRRRKPDSEQDEFAAQWRSHFQMRHEADSDMDRIELHGHAIVQQPPKDTALAAEVIRLWFDRPSVARSRRERGPDANSALGESARHSDTNVGAMSAANVPNPALGKSGPGSSQFRPRQLQAQNNVEIDSPQWKGKCKQLTVLFDEASAKPTELVSSGNNSGSRQRVQPAGRKSTNGLFDDGNTDASPKDAGNSEPLQLSADAIRANVRLLRESDGSDMSAATATDPNAAGELTELWTEGNVDLQQSHGDDQEPMHLTGQRLHLQNAGGNGQLVHVSGQPAVIRDRGLDVEGNDVYLNRLENRTWIEGPGVLRLPVKNDFDGRSLGSPSLLTVWWQEKMVFDGLTATFLDDVKAALNDSRLQCEEMEVVLSQRMSFAGDRRQSPEVKWRQVICKDGVEIDHSLYVNKELTEIRRGQFAKLTLDEPTGKTEAIGPGEVKLWRQGRGKRAALAPRAVAQANRPLDSEVSNWEFTRIKFSGKSNGNMRDRQTTFRDRVRIVYGPVTHPLDTIDPDNLPKDGGEIQCDALQIVQQSGSATHKNYVELHAEGDAKLEGRTFYAQADSISFDESKELYTLRSNGSRQVTIWRQTTPGGDYDEASAKSMRFVPSRNYLQSDKTTGIRGAN